jgi:pre-rRNA-processing protein IPI3
VLRFTNDGAALISGSDDSGVSVWSVSRSIRPLLLVLCHLTDMFRKKRLLDEEMQSDHVAPFFSMSDHTLPVTDIICGIGIFPDCRVLTSSVDHSVKVFYI